MGGATAHLLRFSHDEGQARQGDAEIDGSPIRRKGTGLGPQRSEKTKAGSGRRTAKVRESDDEEDEESESDPEFKDKMEMKNADGLQEQTEPTEPAAQERRPKGDDEANRAKDEVEKDGKTRRARGGKKKKAEAQRPAATKSTAATQGTNTARGDKKMNENKASVVHSPEDGEMSDDESHVGDKKQDGQPKGDSRPPSPPSTPPQLGDRAGVMLRCMSGLQHTEDVRAILKKVKLERRTPRRRFTSELLAAAAASSSPFIEV